MSFNPSIIVFGVGGAGCNAINNMVEKKLQGVQFVSANTDTQSLIHSRADIKIQLGSNLTQGLGAGGNPEVGREAARENTAEIKETLKNCNMLFITAGMGGGTGTGAAPMVAKIAKEMGILTIGVITKPFAFEGRKKMDLALDGIRVIKDYVGTLIIVPNQNLMTLADEKTTNRQAFLLADEVLYNGVAGISDIIVRPGHINLDLADLRGVMGEMGRAVLGTGEANGQDRAAVAAGRAIQNPLLENTDIAGARQLLINISGGDDLTLFETEKAIAIISKAAGEHCNIHIGSSSDDENLKGKMRVSLVATGIRGDSANVANHFLKTFQPEKTDEHLAAIKNTPLNPLREGMYDDGDDEDIEDVGNQFHGIDSKNNTANMGESMAARVEQAGQMGDSSGGRPVFANPFASGFSKQPKQDDGIKTDGVVATRFGDEIENEIDKSEGDNPSDDVFKDTMDDFDDFSKSLNEEGDDHKATGDGAAALSKKPDEEFSDDLAHDMPNEFASEFVDELAGYEKIDDGETTHDGGQKKSGLFKRILSGFFGGADDEAVDNASPYPDVVDLRGDRHDETADDSKPQKQRRRFAKKKNDDDDGESDLFSIPEAE
ncbi:MAG: cell division protein FtsZ [Alphaproteobacteria bacterium]